MFFLSVYGTVPAVLQESVRDFFFLLNNACMLLSTSFIIPTRISMDRAVRQFAIVAVAAAVTMIIPFIMDRAWQLSKIPWVHGSIGLALLLVVCVMGNTAFGAQLSINIGGFSFQPSEFVKIELCIFCGHYVLPIGGF